MESTTKLFPHSFTGNAFEFTVSRRHLAFQSNSVVWRQTAHISEQQFMIETDGSRFRATVLDGDRRLALQGNSFVSRQTTTLTGVADSCTRRRAHRFYLGTCR